MSFTHLIGVEDLRTLQQQQADLMVFDCSFDLMNPGLGREQYLQAHIAAALHADLDHALSAKSGSASALAGFVGSASGGRHPLPPREAIAAWLGSLGFHHGMQAVVYDRQGANYCGRLWWMLKWCGHAAVAVLDGGWQAWQAAGGAVSSGTQAPLPAQPFTLGTPLVQLVDGQQVLQQLGRASQTIVDARAAPRFRGEVEPLDPQAGHIPGALNRPFSSNLTADGYFKSAVQLRAEFLQLLGPSDPGTVVHHCGSGVSAVPNVLAMELADLNPGALYAGSWSDWCSDPRRPIAQGA